MRLIDADKIGLTDFEIVMCNGDYKKALTMLLDKISNQPTAYDVDKTINGLEELRKVDMCDSGDCPYEDTLCHECTQYRMLDKAIEIVKQFGVGKKVEE